MARPVEKRQAGYEGAFPAEVVAIMGIWQLQKGVTVSVLANSGEKLLGLFVPVPNKMREVEITANSLEEIYDFIRFCREKSNEIVIKP
jgi:hypothetical protein